MILSKMSKIYTRSGLSKTPEFPYGKRALRSFRGSRGLKTTQWASWSFQGISVGSQQSSGGFRDNSVLRAFPEVSGESSVSGVLRDVSWSFGYGGSLVIPFTDSSVSF